MIGSGRDDALGDVFVSTPPGYLYSSTLTRFDDLHLPYNVTYEKLSKTTRQTRVLPSTFGSWLRGCNAGDGEPFLFKNILAHPFYLFGTFSGPVKTWQHQNYFLFNCALLLFFSLVDTCTFYHESSINSVAGSFPLHVHLIFLLFLVKHIENHINKPALCRYKSYVLRAIDYNN